MQSEIAHGAAGEQKRNVSTRIVAPDVFAPRSLIMGMVLGALAVIGMPGGGGSRASAEGSAPATVAGLVQAAAANQDAPVVPLDQLEPAAALEVAFFSRKPSGYGPDIVRIKLRNPGPGTVQELQVFATGLDAEGGVFESARARATGQYGPGALALVRIDVPSGVRLENLVVRHWSEQLGSVPLHTALPES